MLLHNGVMLLYSEMFNNLHRLSEITKAYFKMGAERFNETMEIFTQQNVREKGLRGKEKL